MTNAPAAEQLVEQVKAVWPESEATYGDEPDGLGFIRTVSFDTKTSKELNDVLKAIEDERIESFRIAGKDRRLFVYFVPDVRADFRDRYPIEEVRAVLNG
jgi:hypothetical protein